MTAGIMVSMLLISSETTDTQLYQIDKINGGLRVAKSTLAYNIQMKREIQLVAHIQIHL